ncbi:MAG: hypothetical protein JNM93_03895 [Bacteriovoracaceae bacterium]|nr:hypothetical protein [Bacteriovoracaceae bacterium]
MKTKWCVLVFIFLVASCKEQETDYIGTKNLTPAQIEWLTAQEKLLCNNKHKKNIDSVISAMDASFSTDKLPLGKTLKYQVNVVQKDDDKTEKDTHIGYIKVIDIIGDKMLLQIYGIINQNTNEFVDEDMDKFIIYDKLSNRRHLEADFTKYCQERPGSVSTAEEEKIGKKLIFSYSQDQNANNKFTHQALYNFPYFFSLYHFEKSEKITDTISKTVTRRLTVENLQKIKCETLKDKIEDDLICDQTLKPSLTAMNDNDCIEDTNDPFIAAVITRAEQNLNCE